MNQVVKSKQLLDMAKDYFRFVTKFFEVIKVSATHLYHSALELSPTSSIMRKLYYHRRITRSPKIVIGIPESWAQDIATSGEDDYIQPCIWSPCGQFVAAPTSRAVEIRNQLTLELITILHPPETIPRLTGLLAYSPDGRSIACTSNISIIIWDIQTGGVAKETKCSDINISLVWSLDGGAICTIGCGDQGAFTVRTYDVSSGTASFPGTLRSGYDPHLWTVNKSFRVMTTVWDGSKIKAINIFKVRSTLTKVKSFSPSLPVRYRMSFSPTTHHISLSNDHTLSISDVRSSKDLLHAEGNFGPQCFSSDGGLFAASQREIVSVWKYDSGRYTLYGEFRFQDPTARSHFLQFSPTPSSSILGHFKNILEILRLRELPTAPKTLGTQCAGLSRSGTRIATAHRMESTDVLAQTAPQFIDTGVAIESLFLTGNVLLVAGSRQVVAWLLTEEGLVDGVIGDGRAGLGDIIWTVQFKSKWALDVEGQVGTIRMDEKALHVYHTGTGEVLYPTQEPRDLHSGWGFLLPGVFDQNHFRFHSLSQCNVPLKDRWQTSRATVREGWVKDAEGKHRLWIPTEWRSCWVPMYWRHDITTQFTSLGGRPALIKF